MLDAGDGENLTPVGKGRHFDYVFCNASIFILPDVSKTIDEAFACLRRGGKTAFSFYPDLVGEKDEGLFAVAYQRLGGPLPRSRVVSDWVEISDALKRCRGNIRRRRWKHRLEIEFSQEFFSIPARSASLFAGRGGNWSGACSPPRAT